MCVSVCECAWVGGVCGCVRKCIDIMSCHCPDIADFEGAKSKVSVLVSAAESTENLSRMDPMWNPWL